jgi:hypothetical protein
MADAQKRLICVATHHKTGTIWIKRVVMAMSARLDIPWHGIWGEKQLNKVPRTGRAFLCNWSGRFPQDLWNRNDTVFLHVIRDPRDVLLSGCTYHHTAPIEGEEFLHQPRQDLNGKTYQEHLNALASPEDKLLFEMENKHAETLAEMRKWDYTRPGNIELRYEDLMADESCELFRDALTQAGFTPDEVAVGVEIFWQNSLFGGLKKPEARKGRLREHIASNGRLARWQTEIPRAVGEVYAARFQDDLVALGYAQDDHWIKTLHEEASAGGLDDVPVIQQAARSQNGAI